MAKKKEQELKELETALGEREKALNEQESKFSAAFDEREIGLNDREAALEKREAAVADREQALAQADFSLEEEAVQGLSEADHDLIDEAATAYGIDAEFILNANIDRATGDAVILTAGGSRVRYAAGDKVVPLDPIQVDGVVRKKMKPVTGAGRKQDKK